MFCHLRAGPAACVIGARAGVAGVPGSTAWCADVLPPSTRSARRGGYVRTRARTTLAPWHGEVPNPSSFSPEVLVPDALPDLLGAEGVLFDLDGVLTPTAEVHMRAWQ